MWHKDVHLHEEKESSNRLTGKRNGEEHVRQRGRTDMTRKKELGVKKGVKYVENRKRGAAGSTREGLSICRDGGHQKGRASSQKSKGSPWTFGSKSRRGNQKGIEDHRRKKKERRLTERKEPTIKQHGGSKTKQERMVQVAGATTGAYLSIETGQLKSRPSATATTIDDKSPMMAPSTVFFGLTSVSGVFPNVCGSESDVSLKRAGCIHTVRVKCP